MMNSLRYAILFFVVSGCRSDALVEPVVPDPQKVYWRLDVNYPAVMLSTQSPYDTVRLVAKPVNVYGDPIATDRMPVYRNIISVDSSVLVDSTGLVTARYVTQSTSRIEVSLGVGNHVKIDTVFVMVRNDAAIRFIDSVRLRPDSTWRWRGYPFGTSYQNWGKAYIGASEIPANERLISTSYDDPELIECKVQSAVIDQFGTNCQLVGETYIHIKVYAYDRVLSDSILVQRINPPIQVVAFKVVTRIDGSQDAGFFPSELRIRKGNTVFFVNRGIRNTLSNGLGVLLGSTYGNSPKFVESESDSLLFYVDSVDVLFDRPEMVSPGSSYGKLIHTQELYDMCEALLLNCSNLATDGVSGNIAAFGHIWRTGIGQEPDRGVRWRKFNEIGEFRYMSSRFPDATGTIIVTE